MLPPNSEQVSVSWLRSLSQLYTSLVSDASTTLPALATWKRPVFLQVTTVSGVVDRYGPDRSPIVRVDSYAAPSYWGEAFAAWEMVRDATYSEQGLGLITVKANFEPVLLGDVSMFSEPRAVRNEPSLARVTGELQLSYSFKPAVVS